MPIPEELEDQQLLFDHALCHALFCRKKDMPESLPDWTIEDLVDYHWLLQGEMGKRGFIHKSWDDLDGVSVGKSTVESIRGIATQLHAKSVYLPDPHARLVWTGEKQLVIKCRSYGGILNKPLYWGDSEHIYGVLKLTDIDPISLQEFEVLKSKHKISSEELRKRWPDSNRLYAYKFDVLNRFETPIPHQYQRGTQVFFPTPEWKSNEQELTVAVDLDGTIADTDFFKPVPESYVEAQLKPLAQESMADLNNLANVIIYTARDPRYYELTAKWLKKNGISYGALILGKPVADLYIDDLAINFDDNWRDAVDTARVCAEMLEEEKQQAAGPGGETAVDVKPTTHQEAVRTVHSEREVGKSYDVEEGQIILKAFKPLANKPAARYYDANKLPSQFKKYDEVLVEQKFDGMDVMFNKESVWSGRGLDKTKRVPHIIEELKNWPHTSFTLHGQAVMYSDGDPMHRTKAIGFLNGSSPPEEGKNLRIRVFDVIELDGKSLADTPMIDRLKLLRREFKGSEHLPIIEPSQFTVTPPSKLTEVAERMGNLKGSEGAMIFDPQSKWNTKRTINFGWLGKWKKQREIDVLVITKERTEGGWRYLGAIGPISDEQAKTLPENRVADMKRKKWVILGHTHVSSVDVAEGEVLRVHALEIVRNDTIDFTYQNAVPMYTPEKNVPDGLDVAAKLAEQTLHKSPTPAEVKRICKEWNEDEVEKALSHSKCMRCSAPPTIDVLFAEGMGRQWLCDKHFEEWKKETGGPWTEKDPEYDPKYTHEKDICKVYKIKDGEAPKHWREHYAEYHNRREQYEKLSKQALATDPDSGAQSFEPGRTTEGVTSTGPRPEPDSNYTGPEGSYNTEKIKDVENYDPRKISQQVLLDDHRICHAWWSTLQSGKPLKHDRATVRSLHDAIAREIIRRGMGHNSPLEKLEKGDFGAGERIPENPDKTFPETTPLQYTNVESNRYTVMGMFKDRKEVEAWKEDMTEYAKVCGIPVEFKTEEKEDAITVTATFESTQDLRKQLWPPWTGHRADPETGKPLPSEREPVGKGADGQKCRLCGRPITDGESLKRGVGPDCWRNLDASAKQAFLAEAAKQPRTPEAQTPAPIQLQMPPEESTSDKPITWSPGQSLEFSEWNIRFLGTSGSQTFPRDDCDDEQCRADKRLNSSVIYSSEGANILLDVGSKELAEKVKTRLNGICLTHAHPDHVNGIVYTPREVPIYMHRDTWRDLLNNNPQLAKHLAEEREVHLFSTHNAVKIGKSRIRWIPVKHSVKIRTFAIRVDAKLLYCPDFLEIESKWLEGVETWIIDGSSLTRDIIHERSGEGFGHQSILSSLKQAKQTGISQVIVTHIGHIGVKQEDMPKALSDLALQAEYKGQVLQAVDGFTLPGAMKHAAEEELPEPKEGSPYPAKFYKGPDWLHSKSYTYIIHHHFPFGPKIDKDRKIEPGTADQVKLTGSPPGEAGGSAPRDAISAPRDPEKAEVYVQRELAAELSKAAPVADSDFTLEDDLELEKGKGGFREHWETRQDTGDAKNLIGWTLLTYPWPKTQQFLSGSIKGMATAKPAIPKQNSKKFPRGWLDVQGLRKPVTLGGQGSAAERNRCGFYEILEEGTFEYGVQRKNLHEYFFHGKLLSGHWIVRLLQLSSGSPRWLAFRSPDQKPMDPEKHEDEGYWRLAGETEASVQSPGEEKKPLGES
jgi:phosphoribosyl 1,2-cyclic phosphodiesterase/uncharacterized HAD superfamily protein